MVTVHTDQPVKYPGIYRCEWCKNADQSLEENDPAPECHNCKKPGVWMLLRHAQPFAW